MRHGLDLRECLLENFAAPDDLIEATTQRDLRLQIVALRLQPVFQRRYLGECGFELLSGHDLLRLVYDTADALATNAIDVTDERTVIAKMAIPPISCANSVSEVPGWGAAGQEGLVLCLDAINVVRVNELEPTAQCVGKLPLFVAEPALEIAVPFEGVATYVHELDHIGEVEGTESKPSLLLVSLREGAQFRGDVANQDQDPTVCGGPRVDIDRQLAITACHAGDVVVLNAGLRWIVADRLQALQPFLAMLILDQGLELEADHTSRLESEQALGVGIRLQDGSVGASNESRTWKLVDVKGSGFHSTLLLRI
jgi:hypothetical protein